MAHKNFILTKIYKYRKWQVIRKELIAGSTALGLNDALFSNTNQSLVLKLM